MERKLLLVLGLSPFDVGQGMELMRLWADLEDSFNPSVAVAVCLRFDMVFTPELDSAIQYMEGKFKVYRHISRRKATGWPAGCNGLALDAYEWFVFENRIKAFDFEYMANLEADTLPLRKGWANELMNEAYDSKANIIGAMLFPPDCPCTHINANCLMHRNLWKKIRKIFHSPSRYGWDAYIGQEAIRHGTASKLIWQDYRLGAPDNPWRGDDYLFEPRVYTSPLSPIHGQSLQPCMLHGVKLLDGIKAVRKKLLDNKQ